jgi:hypothetical protein
MSEIDKLKDIQDKLCDLAADLKVTTDEAQSALADAQEEMQEEMQECKEELEGFVSVFIDGEVFFKGNIIQMYHIKDYIEENFK